MINIATNRYVTLHYTILYFCVLEIFYNKNKEKLSTPKAAQAALCRFVQLLISLYTWALPSGLLIILKHGSFSKLGHNMPLAFMASKEKDGMVPSRTMLAGHRKRELETQWRLAVPKRRGIVDSSPGDCSPDCRQNKHLLSLFWVQVIGQKSGGWVEGWCKGVTEKWQETSKTLHPVWVTGINKLPAGQGQNEHGN